MDTFEQLLAALQEAVKYSPTQARDWHGRWTSGMGVHPEASINVQYADDVGGATLIKPALNKLFGCEVSDADVAALACAPPGATVVVTGHERFFDLTMRYPGVAGAHVTLDKHAYEDEGHNIELHDDLIQVVGEQGHGLGTHMVATQVATAQRLGVDRITLDAARSDSPNFKMNGYYTWARLGFNEQLAPLIQYRNRLNSYRNLPPVELPAELAHCKDMHDLMLAPGGAAWWKQHGFSVDLSFSPREGSDDTFVLKNYLSAKGQENPGIKQTVGMWRERGCEIPWDADDERAADVAWERLRHARAERKYRPGQPRDWHGRFATVAGLGVRRYGEREMYDLSTKIERLFDPRAHDASRLKADIAQAIGAALGEDVDFQNAAATLYGDYTRDGMTSTDWFRNFQDNRDLSDVYMSGERPMSEREMTRMLNYSSGNLTVKQAAAQMAASNMIAQWAESSGDSHDRSIAMQLAVQQEFGGHGTLDHLRVNSIGGDRDMVTFAGKEYATAMPGLRKFVRVQYALTQAKLSAAGITELPLYRGMEFDEYGTRASKTKGLVVDAKPHEMRVTQQPASSWTVSRTIAQGFSGEHNGGDAATNVVVATTLPVSRVLSTPLSGWGCNKEQEVVVLADATPDAVRYVAIVPGKTPGESIDRFNKQADKLLLQDAE